MSKWIVYALISVTVGIVVLPWALMVVVPVTLIIFDFVILPMLLVKLFSYTRMKNNIIRILMVDDTPETLIVLQKVLAEKDYQLTIVDSGKRAIEQLKNNKFDLIVLDEFMQELSGLETLRRADEIINNGKNNIKTKLPVIMYSSCADEARGIVDFSNFKIIAKLSKQASSSHLRPFVNNIIEDIQGDAA